MNKIVDDSWSGEKHAAYTGAPAAALSEFPNK